VARGVNKVILVGNCGQDPETKFTASGAAIANLSIATSETWKDKQTGQPQERTEWHRVVFFGRLAEIVGEYVRKGSKVYIEGSLRTRKWQDQSGQDRYTTEIVANEMQLLDSRNSDSSGDNSSNNYQGNQGGGSNYQGNQGGGSNYQGNQGGGSNYQGNQGGGSNYQGNQGGGASYQNNAPSAPNRPQAQQPQPAPAAAPKPQYSAPPAMDSFDDDIPF